MISTRLLFKRKHMFQAGKIDLLLIPFRKKTNQSIKMFGTKKSSLHKELIYFLKPPISSTIRRLTSVSK